MTGPHVAVVGGGITGLATAHAVAVAGGSVSLFEAADRLGGKLHTTHFAGRPVDEGADAFLARVPWGLALCQEVGLGDDLVAPSARHAFIWSRGALRPLPDGHVLGVPTDLDALRATGLVDDADVDRAAADLSADSPVVADDVSIGSVVRQRLGDAVHERVVAPLIGGINAGDPDRLSLDAAAPQLAAAARADTSLIRALRAMRERSPIDPDAPVFHAPRAGMGAIVEAIADRLGGHDVRTNCPVDGIEPASRDTWRVTAGDDVVVADAVVVTCPASSASVLVADVAPVAADLLGGVEYASVALATLAYRRRDVVHPLDGSGFLVPAVEPSLVTACTWASSKWNHLADPDTVLFRVSVGRSDNDDAAQADDDLLGGVATDLERMLGVAAQPTETRISRWPGSLPQYHPGHNGRIDETERAIAGSAPGLVVTGAAHRGLGVPACIHQGKQAAAQVMGRLSPKMAQ